MTQGNIIRENITSPSFRHSISKYRTILHTSSESSEGRIEIPPEYGSGNFSCKVLSPVLELWDDELTNRQAIEMTGLCSGNFYCVSFCLSGFMTWKEEISNACFRLEKGEGAFYHIMEIRERCLLDPGQHFNGLCIMIHPDRIESIFSELSADTRFFQHIYSNLKLGYFRFPGECMLVIKQMRNCPYAGPIRTLYIEGKISELLALCFHELGREKSPRQIEIRLSKTDIESLREARKILDASLSKSVPIRNLSRMVGLNEYKLKKGFTQLYGMPVHSHLIAKRMQIAREMLEDQGLTVSEVAEYVGYSSPGSFSRAFQNRYGFNPGDCRKRYSGL